MHTPTLKELLEAGVHFGHRVNKWNPRMSDYIFTQKEGIHILDLEKTLAKLKEAAEFLKGVAKNGGAIVFLSTKRQVEEIVKEAALRCGSMYLTSRWIGGLLTNFEEVSKTIKGLSELEEKRKVMEKLGYTKREQVLVDRKIEKLNKTIGGIKNMNQLPDVLFIIDSHKENNAVLEAKKTGVKVVSLTDTNGDPTLVDYPIPANDDAMKSVSLLVKTVSDAIEEGRRMFEKSPESDPEVDAKLKPSVTESETKEVKEKEEVKTKAKKEEVKKSKVKTKKKKNA